MTAGLTFGTGRAHGPASVLWLSFLAAGNLGLVFAFQFYIVAALGAGLRTDALFTAMVVPQIVLAVTGASLAGVLVPLFSALADAREDAAWTAMHAAGAAATGVASVLYATAPLWTGLLAPGFDEATITLVTTLVRIQLVGVPFATLAAVLWAVGYSRHRFFWAESAPLAAAALCLAALVWVLPRFGLVGAAWVIVARPVLQAAILVPLVGRYRRPDWGNDIVPEGWRRLRPLLLGTTYYKSDELVDRVLASMASPGGLTLLYLGQRIWAAAQGIVSKALVAPLTPGLARVAATRDWVGYRRLLRRRLLSLLSVLTIAAAAALLIGQWGLTLLFRGTYVGPAEAVMLWWILIALLGMWAGGVLGELLAAAFYAMGDTLTPTRIGVLGFTVGIGLKVAGFFLWGVLGIALATSAYYLLNSLLLSLFLSRDLRRREHTPARQVAVS